jgi:pilus assembly protein CpaE
MIEPEEMYSRAEVSSGLGRGYRVVAVEPDRRRRTQMAIELAGIAPSPAGSFEEVAALLESEEPTILLLGASFATDTGWSHAARLTRAFPTAGAVLLAEEVTLPILQHALRAGVRDVATVAGGEHEVRQTIERVAETIVAAADHVMVANRGTHGRIMVSFSTKGGVGKSVVSTNLAVSLALDHPGRVVIVDCDLQFGDVGVMLGVPPVHTTLDAAGAIETADVQLMEALLATHEPSGLRVLCAPTEPSSSDSITPEAMTNIVRLLRTMFDFVVVDMPPHFDDVVLALLEEADDVMLVASMDIPSIKNLKVGMQTLDLLAVAGSKLRLVLNRANAKVNLDIPDVERALGVRAEYRIPSDIAVPQAVNRGVPIVIDKPKSPAATTLRALAKSVAAAAEAETAESGTRSPQTRTPQSKSTRRRGWRRS